MKKYRESNRRLWDEWARIHASSEAAARFYRLEEFKAGESKLRDYEVDEVGDVSDKDLLHLQCHFGLDTLSWARLGARVTGADFSAEAIRLARELAAELKIEATFVESELYALPENLKGEFDVVYTSRGVITWLPDLAGWAQVISHFLRPGGLFYIAEGHPMLWVFDDERSDQELHLRYPYFPRTEPGESPVVGSYADRDAPVQQRVEYWWPHSMGELISSLAGAGLHIDFLHEYPFVDWPAPFVEERGDRWQLPESQPGEIPLSFSLRATKPVE